VERVVLNALPMMRLGGLIFAPRRSNLPSSSGEAYPPSHDFPEKISRGIAPSSVYASDPNKMDASEREQYRAAIHGNREAFEMIIRTHSRTLFAISYGILQSREEAEDVVQDSLLKAWKTRWRVRDPEKFPAWLATIARHRAHDVFRRRRTVPLSEQLAEPIEPEAPNTTALDQRLHSAKRFQSFIGPRSRCVTSKRWIIALSKIPWV
jgi:hypothetical protein